MAGRFSLQPGPQILADRLRRTQARLRPSPLLIWVSVEASMQPRSAAAVILVRRESDPEVYWVRRSRKMAFQGGFYAFPGGQADPNEEIRACAVRELEEELGVRADPSLLLDAGRWVTPAFAPRRFDTCFFLGRIPDGQNPEVQSPELEHGEWIRPAEAIGRWQEGDILMAPPIRFAMQTLAGGLDDIEARMKAIPEANGQPTGEVEMRCGIIQVPLRTPTLPPATHTNCYILGGDDLVVVDPASPYPDQQAVLDGILEKLAGEGRRVLEIWLTHLHQDHVSGANHLRQEWNVSIAAHPITKDDLRGSVDVDRAFQPHETLELGRWRFQITATPGHARGHVCIFEENHGSLITGDLMAGAGTIVIDPPEGHMATYMDSLRRMHTLPVTALFPAHGPVMANAKEKILDYITHREWREQRILEAWHSGLRDISRIVEFAYTDVSPAMHGLAARSASAHLDKLREEKRIP